MQLAEFAVVAREIVSEPDTDNGLVIVAPPLIVDNPPTFITPDT